jgi:hypothetical protein
LHLTTHFFTERRQLEVNSLFGQHRCGASNITCCSDHPIGPCAHLDKGIIENPVVWFEAEHLELPAHNCGEPFQAVVQSAQLSV